MPLTQEQKSLIWRFRYSQSINNKLLLKFLVDVNWQSGTERDQAVKLLKSWAEIKIDQALPLLSGFFSLNDIHTHMRIANTFN